MRPRPGRRRWRRRDANLAHGYRLAPYGEPARCTLQCRCAAKCPCSTQSSGCGTEPTSVTIACPPGRQKNHDPPTRDFPRSLMSGTARSSGRCAGRDPACATAPAMAARGHRDPPSVEDLWRARRRRHRAERHRLRGRGWRVPVDRRPFRLRQVDAAENPRRADAGLWRAGAAQRHADRRAAPGHRRRVPVAGAVSLAQRARQCAAAGRRAEARPREDDAARARSARAGRALRLRASLSVGTVRRHAAARRAGARADPRSGAAA